MSRYPSLFTPLRIKGLEIRNRFLSTSHAPAYPDRGRINERYLRYHEEKARGGIGMTQFGGATAVSTENSFHYGQIDGSTDEVVPDYRKLSDAIHRHGARCSVQLTHGGRRERWDAHHWLPAFSPSRTRELVHGSFPAVMEDHDFRRIREAYAAAARRALDGGVDAVEISCQAGTLIEQFWSPAMNHREDGYGGDLAARMRYGLEILEAVRKAVGDAYVVGIRMPGDEMLEGGLTREDCLDIARAHATSGLVDFISVVGGNASTYQDEARIWPTMWVPSAAYLDLAGAIRAEAPVPIFHATRIADIATAEHAVASGKLDMVGMTRAFIADPHLANKLRDGREAEIRPCVGSGYCVDRVISGHDAVCTHNVATGREANIAQRVEPSPAPGKRVVVVGGGPGGLEAARVSAARGHAVTLLEATGLLGGQIRLASRATWRHELAGITAWLETEIERLGVEVRTHVVADARDVLALDPEVVVIATGGLPEVGRFPGREHATTTWELLSGEAAPGDRVVVYDENGSHAGLSAAEVAALGGAEVVLVTPDRSPGTELGGTNLGAHMKELYRHGVRIVPDTRIARVSPTGNRLTVDLVNTYGGATESLLVDRVVGEHGTIANADLYFALKPHSRNLGEVDLEVLSRYRPQNIVSNPDATFTLFRVGDAWASRNIHAAMLDSMRLCMHL